MRTSTLALMLALSLAPAVSADDVVGTRPQSGAHRVGEYRGVTPGNPETPAHVQRPGGATLTATWPGFQPRPDGASRFFVQTTGAVEIESRAEAHRFVVILHNARLADRQAQRPLVTTHFNTPVRSARLERRGHDLALVLELRTDVTPTVTTEPGEGGFHFVYVTFAAGNFMPASEDVV